jgi:unsaturated rhamnogalacturonyl hydrolase
MIQPLEIAQRIGDKLIRDTPFAYQLELARVNREFANETTAGMQFVDFGRTFGLGRPALACAWTCITAPRDMEVIIQLEHSDGCVLLLNGREVYRNTGERDIRLVFDERSVGMTYQCLLKLKAGANSLLVKSETRGREWRFYMQPPSLKGAVVGTAEATPVIGLLDVPGIDAKIAELTHWLVIGPFPNHDPGLAQPLAAERGPLIGRMHAGIDGPVTWTIPKIEVLGSIIGWQPWGSLYHWSYYNGGTAWAMQMLAEATGEMRFSDYANRFCDYHLEGIPFVEHQVKTLNAVNSANHFIIESPLLDFTLAPSLPFLHRLLTEAGFPNRPLYQNWISRMMEYARHGQVRLPGSGIFTRLTPVEFTTWVDDMFMGIPFLVHASRLVHDPALSRELLDDAASQTLAFNDEVWDGEAELYMHARYHGSDIKLPHWSRCNGWAIWAMSEVLLHLPDDHPMHTDILLHFQRFASSVARFQEPSGFWPNVLDHPDSRTEVSGTAIFTMAIARGVNHGWLGANEFAEVAIAGWEALESAIEEDGTVHHICEGTMCSEDVNFYLDRPFYDNDTHGLFAVLFAAIEVQRLLNSGLTRHNTGRLAALA